MKKRGCSESVEEKVGSVFRGERRSPVLLGCVQSGRNGGEWMTPRRTGEAAVRAGYLEGVEGLQ